MSRLLRLALLLPALLLVGCGGIRVRQRGPADVLVAWRESIGLSGRLSPRTEQTLRRHALDGLYDDHPDAACARLHEEAVRHPHPDLLFALSEIHYQRGQELEAKHRPEALSHYYLCAGYAWHYLFANAAPAAPVAADQPTALAPADAFDPRFRLACDLYNLGLSRCLAAVRKVGRLEPGQDLRMATPDGGTFRLSVVPIGFPWRPEEFGDLRPCDDFEVRGLDNQFRSYGLGVPLVADRPVELPGPPAAHYFKGARFPVTAFFRFDGDLNALASCRCGRLELYNPLSVQSASVGGHVVPLESDLTTPLACMLADSDLDVPLKAFLRPEQLHGRAGLYQIEPYQPDKIPVVFVHGLLSSPLTWAPMLNELQADPLLRRHYQFLFYFYPTGNPYLYSAAFLRRDLQQWRRTVDPQGKDRLLDQTVLVGHSMGGLVSRLLTVDSGDDFRRLATPLPLDQLHVRQETKDELRQVLYFEPQSEVRRVVFLGTPHGGSRLSPSLPGRLAAHFVQLPKTLMDVADDLDTDGADLSPALHDGRLPSSVDLLAPGSGALTVLASRPRPQGVSYHSIIGVAPPDQDYLERFLAGSLHEEGDGVVSYASAHLDGVASELVVTADHYHVHQHPLAVRELRRILRQHLAESAGPVVPVRAEGP
jgi:pimeloyl-ACP methyl ester carboxylesterase